jgi:hypothetical protein
MPEPASIRLQAEEDVNSVAAFLPGDHMPVFVDHPDGRCWMVLRDARFVAELDDNRCGQPAAGELRDHRHPGRTAELCARCVDQVRACRQCGGAKTDD